MTSQERKHLEGLEETRIRERKATHGEKGLAKLHEELEAARALNNVII